MLTKVRNNRVISKINKFIDGRGFAPVFAAFVLAVHCLGLDVAGYVLSVLLFVYINVFCDDVRPVFVIAFLVPMCASEKHAPGYNHGDGYYSSIGVIIALSLCVAAILATIVYRFVICKGYKNLFKKAPLAVGLIIFSATLLTAGLFSKYWSVDSLFVAGMVIGTSLLFYVYASVSTLPKEDNLRYIGRLCAITTVEILIQLLIFYIGNFDFSSGVLDGVWKGNIIVGWGISNSIGEFLVLMLAGVLSLAYTEERGFVYYVLAMLSLVGAYFTLSRCAVLIGVGVFAVGSVAIAIASKEKQKNRLLLLVFLAALALAIAFLARTERIEGFFKFFKDSGFGDRGRFGLWKEFMELWKEYPVLGTGFAAFKKIHSSPSVFHNFAHDTIVQMLSSAGVVGLLGYMIHRIQTIKLFVSKPTINRLFLVLGVASYVAMGLIDTITFFASFIVVYTIFLVCIEKDLAFCLETQNGEKVNEET